MRQKCKNQDKKLPGNNQASLLQMQYKSIKKYTFVHGLTRFPKYISGVLRGTC